MTWAMASTYEGNRKFHDGLSCKSFVEKKQDPWEHATKEYKR
jgi:hypothetical protein